MTLQNLFKPNMIRPNIGDIVKHNTTHQIGEVIGRAKMVGSFRVYVLTIKFDNGFIGSMVPEREYIKIGRA